MITDAWKYQGKTPSPSSLETRKRDSFSRLDEFHTIVVIVPFAKIKKKENKASSGYFSPCDAIFMGRHARSRGKVELRQDIGSGEICWRTLPLLDLRTLEGISKSHRGQSRRRRLLLPLHANDH